MHPTPAAIAVATAAMAASQQHTMQPQVIATAQVTKPGSATQLRASLVLALALALVSVLVYNAHALASTGQEWAALTLHAASTCACALNLLSALLAQFIPTPAPGATAACHVLP